MFEKPESTHTLGLEMDGTVLKGAELTVIKGIPTLQTVYEVELKPDLVNPLDMSDEGQKLKKTSDSCLTVTALESDEVLIRTLDIKLKKDRDIDAVLAFQAEPLLPFPVENTILDRITTSQTDEGTISTLLAVRKDLLQQHLDRYSNFGIDSEVVTCVPIALAFYSKLVVESTSPHFIVHLGRAWTTCALVSEGKLLAAQSSHEGLEAVLEAFLQDSDNSENNINSLDFSALSKKEYPQLNVSVDHLQREIARLLSAIAKQNKAFDVADVLFTGEGTAYDNLCRDLCQRLSKNWIAPKIPAGFASTINLKPVSSYAVPIGAAFSALAPARGQINFRQNEFAYPHPWRRLKQPLMLYGLLTLGLAIATLFFGQAYVATQEDDLRQQFVSLLSTMNKAYPAFEKDYERKAGIIQNNEEPIRKAESLTTNEISDRLSFLQKDLKDSPDSYPLQPNVPRVSDVLAWLSTHPQVTAPKEGGQPGEMNTFLNIESFNYSMVKRPEIKKKQEKYQVKVEIEFTAAAAKFAREFHDALIAPNNIVDPKGEVKWSANKGKYRASFFLKDKTLYP